MDHNLGIRSKNNRKKIVAGTLLILLMFLLTYISNAERLESEQPAGTDKLGKQSNNVQAMPTAPAARSPEAKADVLLYFASKNNDFLVAHGGQTIIGYRDKKLSNPDDPVMFAKNIIQALIRGPDASLMRTIPQDTKLRALYLTGDGTAYADFSAAIKDNHPGGVMTELITIYSIVNSLVLNITGIDRVKFLIEGREALTLAGHIDLQNPFTAEMLLIR